jgi:hypothetical protein
MSIEVAFSASCTVKVAFLMPIPATVDRIESYY